LEPIYAKSKHFAKTGSGQTWETLTQKAFCFVQVHPLFARLNAHPVQLWLLEEYMECGVIAAHTAAPRINMPRDYWTQGETGGWHCDTP